jgi:hypothetical protein
LLVFNIMLPWLPVQNKDDRLFNIIVIDSET